MKHLHLPLLLFSISFLFTRTSCQKDVQMLAPKYDFYEKISINPQNASYAVGDTIWLNFKTTNKTFFDSLSRTRVSSDSFSYYLGTHIFAKLNASINPGESFCNIINPAGATPNTFYMNLQALSVRYKFACDNLSNYDVKIGVVPIQKGLFVISLQDEGPVSKCSGVVYSNELGQLKFRFIGNTNKNIFTSLPAIDRTNYFSFIREESFDQQSAFAFTVQ